MTRMLGDVSGLVTTRVQQEWNPLFVQCLCVLMRDGIKFSSTCLISLEEPMVPTILKRSGKDRYVLTE